MAATRCVDGSPTRRVQSPVLAWGKRSGADGARFGTRDGTLGHGTAAAPPPPVSDHRNNRAGEARTS